MRPLSLVVVDDECSIIYAFRMTLDSMGHKVIATGANGLEAIELYRAHHPDVLIIDFRMPLMDGLKASDAIRKEFPDAHIIMCSAYQPAASAGSIGDILFLSKPLLKEDLDAAFHRLIDPHNGGSNGSRKAA
ncbi:MAG: response regulator [Verrucomicrobiota bacterium]|nr:response regulator [Verrucomicrobiota bacterium]